MSKQIVEQHGGRIWAEFPEDGGTRFVVELPVGPVGEPPEADRAERHDTRSVSGRGA